MEKVVLFLVTTVAPRLHPAPRMSAAMDHRSEMLGRLDGALVLAPLTRAKLPFRRLCADFGCRVAFSEMAVAHKLLLDGYEGRRERSRLHRAPNEDCFGLQIATTRVSEGVFAGRLALESGCNFLDLNCGCPTPDVTGEGMGAALLQDPGRLAELVSGIVAGVPDLPVTVKLRTGSGDGVPGARAQTQAAGAMRAHRHRRRVPGSGDLVGKLPGESGGGLNIERVVKAVVEAGAAAVTIHGRTWSDRYTRDADWNAISRGALEAQQLARLHARERVGGTGSREGSGGRGGGDGETAGNARGLDDGRGVRAWLSVTGSGDVFTHEHAREMLQVARIIACGVCGCDYGQGHTRAYSA